MRTTQISNRCIGVGAGAAARRLEPPKPERELQQEKPTQSPHTKRLRRTSVGPKERLDSYSELACFLRPPASSACRVQPSIVQRLCLKSFRLRFKVSVRRAGMPRTIGNMPMMPSVFWSWKPSQRCRFSSRASLLNTWLFVIGCYRSTRPQAQTCDSDALEN